jgi:1-deoxy-D-xylulose-5-phosphate reductoisomerase
MLNAANEMAVASFLSGKLPFLAITQVIEDVLQGRAPERVSGIEHVLAVDSMARELTAIAIQRACERR